ncbi:hypothetical protein GF382_02380 [Candidatus Falkowbacteria bacterium]|nr:hypothetical protein [Candidatus Falkowbacteria bacterium]
MICLNCKKQIPDDSSSCPHCGTEVSAKHQLGKEISFRRWQRWFFYTLIAVIFLGMVGVTVKFYNSNTKLVLEMANIKGDLNKKSEVLAGYADLEARLKKDNDKLKSDLALESEKLTIKTSEAAKQLNESRKVKSDYENCLLDLNLISDNYKNLINSTAVGISDQDLKRFLVADFNLDTATDTDKDGLSDKIEDAIGTNANLMDSDSDGYSDKAELLSGFDPTGSGSLPIDNTFASRNQGRVFKQVEADDQAWYIGKDSKRYFLGKISQ